MEYSNEWTQAEYLKNKQKLSKENIQVILVDTVLSPIENEQTIPYNPNKLKKYKDGTIFVFYCDSGKGTLSRVHEYKKIFPHHHCISLKGGKTNWKKNMVVFDVK